MDTDVMDTGRPLSKTIGGCHRKTGVGPQHVLLAPMTSRPTIIDEGVSIRSGLSIFPVPELQV
jgi:hypothetical protein